MRRNNQYIKEVGLKVKSARNKKGISVRQLGLMCSIDYSNLSRFENGQKDIRISTLKLIANKLEMDIKEFL